MVGRRRSCDRPRRCLRPAADLGCSPPRRRARRLRLRARPSAGGARHGRPARGLPARPLCRARGDHRALLPKRPRPDRRVPGLQVIHGPHIDWFALAGVNSLLAASALALLSAVLVPGPLRRPVAASLCALGYATAIGFTIALYVKSPHGHGVVVDAFRRDRLAQFAGIILAGSGLLATAISYRERMREHHGEYYALLAAAGGGMLFFVAANNLLTLFLGLEWFSISLYILCAFDVDVVSSLEAGLKYLIVGSFGSAVLLFGSALVYGTTGHLDFSGIASAGHTSDPLFIAGLALIIAGLGFKASAAPFHMWTPDVYEGAPTGVTAFMAS